MIILNLIWIATSMLVGAALVLWLVMLVTHGAVKRREIRARQHSERWLDQLLNVLDGAETPEALELPRSSEELEAVLGLLRELAERFKGSYAGKMELVLARIGAADFGLRLLRSRRAVQRLRGAALLAWCPADTRGIEALEMCLHDRDPRVVLEAASALVRQGAVPRIDTVVKELCRSRAAKSLLARDLFRRWGTEHPDQIAELLECDWPAEAWTLLYEAAGGSGSPDLTVLVSRGSRHPSPYVVLSALAALSEFGDPLGAAPAVKACADSDPRVRRQAVVTLTSCAKRSVALPLLRGMLDDPSFEVRRAVFEAMLHFGGRSKLLELPRGDAWQEELFREAGLEVGQAS